MSERAGFKEGLDRVSTLTPIEARLVALEARVLRLEKVSDQNARVFSESLQFAELCIQALQRALDDMARGNLKTIEIPERTVFVTEGLSFEKVRSAPLAIDFKAYLNDALQQHLGTEVAADDAQTNAQTMFDFGG